MSNCATAPELLCKHSLEARTYTFDFRRLLDYESGERLDIVLAVTADGVTINVGTATIAEGQYVNTLLTGGIAGVRYTLTARVRTDKGQELVLEGLLDVV